MNHAAIIELYKLLKERDWTDFCPEKSRQILLDKWIERWIIDVEQCQSVVDKKYLGSEHLDAIKYKLGEVLGESLAEECVEFKVRDTKVTASMIAFRRKEK